MSLTQQERGGWRGGGFVQQSWGVRSPSPSSSTAGSSLARSCCDRKHRGTPCTPQWGQPKPGKAFLIQGRAGMELGMAYGLQHAGFHGVWGFQWVFTALSLADTRGGRLVWMMLSCSAQTLQVHSQRHQLTGSCPENTKLQAQSSLPMARLWGETIFRAPPSPNQPGTVTFGVIPEAPAVVPQLELLLTEIHPVLK